MGLLLRLARVSCAQSCSDGIASIRPLISLASFTATAQAACGAGMIADKPCGSRPITDVDQGACAPLTHSWMRVNSFASHAFAQYNSGLPMYGHLHSSNRGSRPESPACVTYETAWRSAVGMQPACIRTQSEQEQRPAPQPWRGLAQDAAAGAATGGSAAQRTTQNVSRETPAGNASDPDQKQVLYRGKGIVLFRLLVRLKVFQLLGIAGISVVATTILSQGPVATLQMGVLSALVAGCGIASATLWYFSRRYLGEISLSPSHPGHARFSVLDFWGRREDNLIRFQDIVPTLGALSPAAAAELAEQPLIPIRVLSDDRQYLLSWRHGHLLQRDALRDLLEGRLAQQQQQQQQQEPP